MAIQLTDAQKQGMFKKLASTSLYDVGIEYGLDKHYSTPKSVKTKVYTIYREILADPAKYGVLPETTELVQEAVSNRAIKKPGIPLVEKKEDARGIKELVTSNRDIAANLINKKLTYISKSKKSLDNVSLSQLGTLFGILFDKGQIISGQATEHVAVMSKIESNLSPEELLEITLKQRENTIISKEK